MHSLYTETQQTQKEKETSKKGQVLNYLLGNLSGKKSVQLLNGIDAYTRA